MNWKKTAAVLCSAAGCIVLFAGLQRLVEPKYTDIPEGNFTAEYYEETTDHDVILIGDCEIYESFNPMYLWENFGITSYDRGNAQQLVWQSYYMLEDTLRYETPKVVVYNVQSLTHNEPQKETYNRMTLDGMRWSAAKLSAIYASMCEGEQLLDYLFPLLRYHDRILELSRDDFTYYFQNKKVSHNGYYMRVDVLPLSEADGVDADWLLGSDGAQEASEAETVDPWAEIEGADEALGNSITENSGLAKKSGEGEAFGSYAMEYLDKLRELCQQKGIQLLFVKAPSVSPQWYESDNEQVVAYAEKYEIPYLNFYELLEETGIDYETDTYDGGLHMNSSGANKLSDYLGEFLVENYQLADHRSDAAYSEVYEQKYQFYLDMIDAQEQELAEYGKIISY